VSQSVFTQIELKYHLVFYWAGNRILRCYREVNFQFMV
jgi:hypothetical protein